MDKRAFMVESARTGAFYCGRCGRKMLYDHYNMFKHACRCGGEPAKREDLILAEEGKDWGYLLEEGEQSLLFSVCTPRLKVIRGFTDRFHGMEWEPVFRAEFPAGSRTPLLALNKTGLEMDVLLSLVRAGRICRIGEETDKEIIRRVFPGVPDVFSLQMFAYIYQHRGFAGRSGIDPGLKAFLINKCPSAKEWKSFVPVSSFRRQMRGGGTEEAIPVYAALYRDRKGSPILQVILKRKKKQSVFLFARGYACCSEDVDLKALAGERCILVGPALGAVLEFDRLCPEYLLKQYVRRSANILVPLLSPGYHNGMELAAKAGAAGIAERFDTLTAFDNTPWLYRNLKDMFGLPVSVLRALDRDQVSDAILERMKEIFRCSPAFLQFDSYTPSMMEFFMRADLTRSGRPGIPGIRDLTDRQILQILRYLEKHPGDGHYYCDYLRACAQLGEYPCGLTPGIGIREAHDRVVGRIRNRHDSRTRMSFEAVVSDPEYRKLSTCLTEEDEESFGEDPYLITVPRTSDDLFIESEAMHNCVRIYVDAVAAGRTRICFLREKKDPAKSCGTIEVSGDGRRLVQAKGFANKALPVRAQRFVKKWCASRRIRICTCDITCS